jgi:hypothetical protein
MRRPFASGAGAPIPGFPARQNMFWGTSALTSPDSVTPTINYNFLSGALPSGLTFTRASTGYYYNSSGILTAAATNTPRFDYNPSTLALNGLLLEGQATNSCINSGNIAAFNNSGATTVSNAGIAPDGTTTASLLSDTLGVTQGFGVYQGFYSTSNIIVTQSFYAKAGVGGRYCVVSFGYDSGDWVAGMYDLVNGVVSATKANGNATFLGASIQACPNGWYRISLTAQSTIPGYSLNIGLSNSGSASAFGNYGNVSYTGTGASIYAWGCQNEQGYGPSSYIPTTSAYVTRAADVLNASISTAIPSFNSTVGTMTVGILKNYFDGTYQYDVGFDNGASSNRIELGGDQASGNYLPLIQNGGSIAYLNPPGITYGTPYTAGMAWNNSNFTFSINGGSVQTSSAVTTPTANTLRFSDTSITGNYPINGWLQSFKYWNTALTNSQLQQVTT